MPARLRYLPISVFSLVLGLSGYTIATQRVFSGLGWGETWPTVLLVATSALYGFLLALYAAKLVRHRDAVAAEFRHPVMISFFPALSISLLLLAIGYADVAETLSLYLWVAGAALNLLFTVVVLSIWMRHTHFEINHFSPAWFIPVVGNLIVPVVGYAVARERMTPALNTMKSWLQANNATVMAVLFLVLGAKVLGDGIAGITA